MKLQRKWKSLNEILTTLAHDKTQCHAEVLSWLKQERKMPTIMNMAGRFQVHIDGYVLETFNSENAAKFYCKRFSQ